MATAATLLLLAACGTTDAADAEDQTLTVLAAASLTETFTDLAETFEAEHPGVEVRLAFDSSATLATQVVQGAPGDVLATADTRTMREVTQSGTTDGEPTVFATNTMVLVVPAGNPADLHGFADLDRPGTTYVTCVESAPCGAITADLLDSNGISAEPSSREIDVKAVLTKVVLDEADAGIVYASDAVAAGSDVETIEIPGAAGEVTEYEIALLEQSTQPGLAEDWIDLVRSDTGQEILREAGFGTP